MSKEIKAIESGKRDREEITLPTSSRKVIIVGLVLVAVFFGGLGGWAAVGKLQGAVIAHGEVIVESYRKQVQHLDGGIIDAILVREGDMVEKGQVLIRLDGERVWATRDLLRGQMDALEARQARLTAEMNRDDRISWPRSLEARSQVPEVAEHLRSEEIVFTSRLAAMESQKSIHRARISQLQSKMVGQERQLLPLERIITSLEEEIAAKTELVEEGYLDRSQLMALERALEGSRLQRDDLKTQLVMAREQVAELELTIADLETHYVHESVSRLADVKESIQELRERLRPAEDASRRLEITAPESGVVVNLRVRTEGGVIRGSEPLLEIVPRYSGLILSVKVNPAEIDDVRLGQQASVSLSAFPIRYTSRVDGTVTYVSADRSEPQNSQEFPHYLVYVELDPESLREAIGDVSRLTPGMPAEVYIQTEARTVLSYLLTPITESMNRSFRE